MTDKMCSKGKIVVRVLALVAIAFGVLTIKSGGAVLFWSEEARIAAGNYVPFVLWFNFLAGFVYIITGIGLLMFKPWAPKVAAILAASTLTIFAALGVGIAFADLAHETRTIGAMVVRSTVWTVIALLTFKIFSRGAHHD